MDTSNGQTLPQVRVTLMELAKKLRVLSDETFFLEHQIARVIGNICELEKKLPPKDNSKIITFPGEENK
ncbi:MAG: hypothetical protein LBL43_01590 [Treponema sp.]|jgi:hypothetical protein|nr:hypothetical protein [Treponema sp.]